VDDERDAALIAASYDLASGATRLEQIPDLLTAATSYGSVLLSLREGRTPLELATNLPSAVLADYAAHYHKLDPWTRALERWQFEKVFLCPSVELRGSFEATEFYQDFARQVGLVDPMGVKLKVTAKLDLHLGLNNRQRLGDADGAEIGRFARFADHLRRGLSLRERFGAVERQNGLFGSLLDQASFGIAVLDHRSKVKYLNRPAETIMAAGYGLSVRHDRLLAEAPTEQTRLAAGLAGVLGGDAGGEALLLHHPTSGGMVAVVFSPLPQHFGRVVGPAQVLVTLSELTHGQSERLNTARLRSLFGFTTSEAEIAAGIGMGQSLESLADQRSVRPSTVRTQLDAVFLKTGARSQRELIQLLGRLPAQF